MAEVGATYMGKVVNITKFGAFVNILPGRDGLVHISKLGGGKRINSVEDVLELGQEIEVGRGDRRERQGQPRPPRGRVPRAARAEPPVRTVASRSGSTAATSRRSRSRTAFDAELGVGARRPRPRQRAPA
jgi:hypothetical protein